MPLKIKEGGTPGRLTRIYLNGGAHVDTVASYNEVQQVIGAAFQNQTPFIEVNTVTAKAAVSLMSIAAVLPKPHAVLEG